MNTSYRNSILITIISIVGLTGFDSFFLKGDPIEDVHNFISDVKASTRPNNKLVGMEVEKVVPYVPYKITAVDSNPFAVKNFVGKPGSEAANDDALCADNNCGDGPPAPHAPYFLEKYNIDQLSMIGTMKFSHRGQVALIQTPDAGIVYAGRGEYIGRNNGLILSVGRNKLIVREKYRSPKGWQDRMATLPLLKK